MTFTEFGSIKIQFANCCRNSFLITSILDIRVSRDAEIVDRSYIDQIYFKESDGREKNKLKNATFGMP